MRSRGEGYGRRWAKNKKKVKKDKKDGTSGVENN
jgi:hypothetical protein